MDLKSRGYDRFLSRLLVGPWWIGRSGHHMLCTLLLGHEFFLLGNNFRLVFEGEGKGQSDEECGRGDDPDDVPDDLAGLFYDGGCLGYL